MPLGRIEMIIKVLNDLIMRYTDTDGLRQPFPPYLARAAAAASGILGSIKACCVPGGTMRPCQKRSFIRSRCDKTL